MCGGQLGVALDDVAEEDGQEVLEGLGGFKAVAGGLRGLLQREAKVAGEVALDFGQALAQSADLGRQLFNLLGRLPRALVQVVHALLEFRLNAVGELGDHAGKALVEEDVLGCGG